MNRRALVRTAGIGAAALVLPAAPAMGSTRSAPAFVRSGRPLLTHGVQAGDVHGHEATLWARADRPSRLVAEISRDPSFRRSVTLTADVHYTAAHHYSPDRAAYQRFDPFWEFVSGPLNAGAFGPNALDGTFGPKAEFVAAAPHANTGPGEGAQFFGEVQIDGPSRELTVTLRDVEGKGLFSRTLEPHRR